MVTSTIMRATAVPTDDLIVRRQLRDLNQPMSYFGEGPAERRDRLTKALANLSPEERQKLQELYETKVTKDDSDETFYYEGPDGLIKARYEIAAYSLKQASLRLDEAKFFQMSQPPGARLVEQQEMIDRVRNMEDMGTYIDYDLSNIELKTLTSCNLNPDATLIATSYRSGKCKLLSLPDVEPKVSYNSGQSMANFIIFSPKSGQLNPDVANLASCAMDGIVSLWNLNNESPVCLLSGAKDCRVTRVRYHPCGFFLASCCSDKSWRLTDLNSQQEILHQEGHSDAVSDLAFHPDGSLAASAGMDAYGIVWDLRSGQMIHRLEGHTNGIKTIDISPDGYLVATGGLDNSVKIWDLRKRSLEYTIPAHLNIVTSVMFEKKGGHFLVSSSFDKTVKFWSTGTWAPVKILDSYDDKVMKIDLSSQSDMMISCHFKYLKWWSIKNT